MAGVFNGGKSTGVRSTGDPRFVYTEGPPPPTPADPPTLLDDGASTALVNSAVTATVSPSDDHLLVFIVSTRDPNKRAAQSASDTFGGLTWTRVGSAYQDAGGGQGAVTVFYAMGSGLGTGEVTAAFSDGDPIESHCWALFEIGNVPLGLGGANAVGNTDADEESDPNTQFSSDMDVGSVSAGSQTIIATTINSAQNISLADGWTELVERQIGGPDQTLAVYYKQDDPSGSTSWAVASLYASYAMEVLGL